MESLRDLPQARSRKLRLSEMVAAGRSPVLQFLFESELIYKKHTLLDESDLFERRHNIVSLQQADLSRANLSQSERGQPE